MSTYDQWIKNSVDTIIYIWTDTKPERNLESWVTRSQSENGDSGPFFDVACSFVSFCNPDIFLLGVYAFRTGWALISSLAAEAKNIHGRNPSIENEDGGSAACNRICTSTEQTSKPAWWWDADFRNDGDWLSPTICEKNGWLAFWGTRGYLHCGLISLPNWLVLCTQFKTVTRISSRICSMYLFQASRTFLVSSNMICPVPNWALCRAYVAYLSNISRIVPVQ